MKTYIFLVVAVLYALLPATTFAEDLNKSDANIVGHVLEKHSKEHLSYISVSLKGTTIGTLTDGTGHYFLKNLPEGEFVLQVSAVGYKTLTRNVVLKKGVTLEENFELEEDLVALDGVVVTANRSETTRRLAPTLVNVMDFKLFEQTNSTTLAQGLNFQPGVRVENNCQNCGFQQVRINGLDGPYTQILIDSRPVFSALAGVYGLEQIPANMIERVEVMRGGGSALFGASAIAGTINIITKEPLRNSAQLGHTIMGVGGLSVFDNNTTMNASLVTDDHKAGIYVFGQNRQRSGFDYDGDGFTELPQLRNQTVGFRSYLKTSTYSKLTFEYHHLQEFRRGGNLLDRPPHETDITEQTQHSINSGSVKFDYFSPNEKHRMNVYASVQHIDRDSYYGGDHSLDAYGATTDLTWVVGSQYVYHFDRCLFLPADLTGGVEYNQDAMHDNMWGYNRRIDQTVRIAGAFLQNEWKNDRWSFLVGGRLDKHNLIDHVIFSPRVNLRYNPTKDINFRAAYSVGEEKSRSFSLSADMYHRWGAWQGNLLLEGFYTDLSDVCALREIGTENGILKNERYNEKGARVYGMTLEGKLAWLSVLQLQAGVTLQKAEYKEARQWSDDETVPLEKRIFRTPDTYGYMTLTYSPVKPLSIALSGTYTGSMLVEHRAGYIEKDRAETTPDFWEMNLKAAYDFTLYNNITLQVNAGVQNLFNAYQKDFDQGKLRDSGYIYGPGLPRSYFAGVKISY